MLVREVLFPVKPDVIGSLESFVFVAEPFAMFLPADLGHRLAQMLHDVKPVVGDFVRRPGYMLDRSLEVRFHMYIATSRMRSSCFAVNGR